MRIGTYNEHMLQSSSAAALEELRRAIRAQEAGLRPASASASVIPLGLPAVDAALPWGGLPAGGLHEILTAAAGGTGSDAAALAFAVFAAGRFQQAGREAEVVWCRPVQRRQEGGLPYGPGLRRCGLDPRRLVLAEARRQEDLCWALEEALRDGRAAAIIGESGGGGDGTGRGDGGISDLALRRLQLAAEQAGRPLFLLRPEARVRGRACPSLTRWKAEARPAPREGDGILPPPAWRLDLLRCRGGQPQAWTFRGDLPEALSAELPRTPSGEAAGEG